ncbi:uncharacterized protein LOC133181103 [Saccostrea echinata]|uniref:uncharacterized protein LOC133181103 n=1 Tax=Saccostrea echinata TaxID=191078 RepID=UPI002A8306E9|nr:uncharacterized protein LOC133181103 [Saccostrea echinata]
MFITSKPLNGMKFIAGLFLVFICMSESCDRVVERTDFLTEKTTSCCFVECQPNFYVRRCEVNNTADRCEPCPPGSLLLDPTNSYFPFPCRRYDCPPETRRVNSLSKTGCRIPCECDESRGYSGADPCLCRRRVLNRKKEGMV